VYVFKTDVLIRGLLEHCGLGQRYDFGHDIIPSLIASRQVFAYDFRDSTRCTPRYWRDVGTVDSYYRANMDLVRSEPPFNPYLKNGSRFRPEILFHGKTSVSGTARLTRSITSPGVRIAEGAFVEDSILLPGVQIGKGAQLRRVIVEDGVSIPEGFQAGFDVGRDRLDHAVTAGGVVLISSSPKSEGLSIPRSGRVVRFCAPKHEKSARTRSMGEL
jgi:glucose-1-phosphate adenylyltransferase